MSDTANMDQLADELEKTLLELQQALQTTIAQTRDRDSKTEQLERELAAIKKSNEALLEANSALRGALTQRVNELATITARAEKAEHRLVKATEMTMGVGDGSGQLFVHGSYESIKAAQAIVLRAESAEKALAESELTIVGLDNGLSNQYQRAEQAEKACSEMRAALEYVGRDYVHKSEITAKQIEALVYCDNLFNLPDDAFSTRLNTSITRLRNGGTLEG